MFNAKWHGAKKMSCYNPLTIQVKNPNTGNQRDVVIACRHCIGCLLDYQDDWKIRICHHASMTENNHFVTFSYSPENYPMNGLIYIEHMQAFHKKLRKKFLNSIIQMVYKGEYSPTNYRPHWHAIYFNLPITDLVINKTNHFGDKLYTSETINDLWGYGNVIIGAVSPKSAAYIARDLNKTDKPDKAAQYKINAQGILVKDLKPIFQMSRCPGIAKKWIDAYMWDVFPSGTIIFDGKPKPAPEFYVKQLEKLSPDMHALFLIKRHESIFEKTYKHEHTPERLNVKKICLESRLGKDNKKNESF